MSLSSSESKGVTHVTSFAGNLLAVSPRVSERQRTEPNSADLKGALDKPLGVRWGLGYYCSITHSALTDIVRAQARAEVCGSLEAFLTGVL